MDDTFTLMLITGHQGKLTKNEMTCIFRHPYVIAVHSTLIGLLLYLNPYPMVDDFPIWVRATIFYSGMIVGLFSAWCAFIVMYVIERRKYIKYVYSTVYNMVGAVSSMGVSYQAALLFGAKPTTITGGFISLIIMQYIVVEHVSTLIAIFIAPRAISKMRNDEPLIIYIPRKLNNVQPSAGENAEADRSETIDISSNTSAISKLDSFVVINKLILPIKSLMYISSHGNYLKLHGDNFNHFEAFRMRDVVSQIPAKYGFNVHRSYWVNFRYIKEINNDGRRMSVTLFNGDVVPVSRHNQLRFKSAFENTRCSVPASGGLDLG